MNEAHVAIMALVYTWQARIEEFGAVVFKPWHDGKLALLNEQQAIFLLGKMRKTYFRKHLIKVFGDFKWQNRQTLAATQLATEKAGTASSVLAEAAVVVNAACPPKPKQVKPKQAESASRSVITDTSSPVLGAGTIDGIVTLVDGQPVTTTLAIAEGTNVDHASVIKLVRAYQADLEEFGPLGFEIQKGKSLPQGGFAKSTEYATLSESQSTLILTYMRNTDIVRGFKKRLVKAFFMLVKGVQPQFAIPQTYHEALRLSADLAEKNAVITGQLAIASEQLSITAPKGHISNVTILDRV